jgi:photosystem II stability/assembly factor-like uncharacterized protein
MAVIPNESGGMCLFGGYWAFRSGLFRLTGGDNIWTFDSLILDEAIFDLAVSGANLYAATCQGVILSTDYGNSWTQMNNGLPPNTCIRTISAIPNGSGGTNLFAVPEGNGVFLSTDNGTTWTLANSGLSSMKCFAAIDTNLFAGTSGSGVFRSTNNGTTWTPVNNGLGDLDISYLAVIGSNIFARNWDGIFLSTDNGESWTEVSPDFPLINPRVICLIASGTNLWAGSYGGIFLSTNNGTSWTLTNYGLISSSINCFAVSGTNLFAGTEENGAFLSTDNGSSWSSINSGLKDNFIRALAISGTNLFAGTFSGVFLSTNNGTYWTEVNSALTNIGISSIVVAGTNLFVGTGDGVFRSTDNGTSWTAVSIGLTNKNVYSLAVMDSHLFAGTWGGGVFVSTNNGTSWTGANSGLQDLHIGSFAVSGPNLFTSTGSGIFVSSNNGTTWSVANAPFFTFAQMLELGSYLFAGAGGMGAFGGEGVYVSTDNGRSWNPVNSGWTGAPINALAVCGTALFAGTSYYGVWRRPLSELVPVELISFTASANGKEVTLNWSTATELNNQGFEVQRKFGSNDFVTVGSVKGNGTTTSPNQYSYIDKLIDGGKYFYRLKQIDYAGTFEYSNEIEVDVRVLDKFALDQNYPNPFNPTTTIGFGIQASPNPSKGGALVTLKVFDILGNEVKTLVNKEMESGYHSVEFDASNLQSGVYFYRIQAGNYIETKKMLLLR